jgi:hypothetical protein
MATTAVQRPAVMRRPANPMWDRTFFSGMILLLWATVLFGFSKTYYAAGMVRAPLPNALIHIHGAAMTLWMILLLVQTCLITARRVAWHRILGLAGFGLAAGMLVIGLLAATDMLRRGKSVPGLDAKTFYIVPLSAILQFSGFAWLAYRARTRPVAHKRLILMGTIALMDAAIGRWPVALLQAKPPLQDLVTLAFLLLIVGYDLLSLHRVQRSTLWGSVTIMTVHLTRIPLAGSHVWQAFATKMSGH